MTYKGRVPVWALLLVGLLCLGCLSTHAQPQTTTRAIEKHNDDIEQQGLTALAIGSPSAAVAQAVVDEDDADEEAEEELDSGQLLFQSIPDFPEAEMQALEKYTGILRTPAKQPASDSSNHQGGTAQRSAADDFIEALLKTTRASLVGSRSSMQHDQVPAPEQEGASGPAANQKTGERDSTTADGADDSTGATPSSPVSTDTLLGQQAPHAPEQQSSTVLQAETDNDSSDSQRLADTASAVEGQVLVTQAELIPSMQHYSQVVLMSVKVRPMLAQDLLAKVSAGDAPAATKAATWQDNLQQALEAAVALETNTSVSQMHTRMTSILNLGLELEEPPLPHAAAAAASSVADSVKALTGDGSVLVGVSLIRLSPHGTGPDSNTSRAALTADNDNASSSISSSSDSVNMHPVHGRPAAVTAGKGNMLAMLTLYGMGPPSNAVAIVQRMLDACPELFSYGTGLSNSSCGRAIIRNYVSAVLAAQAPQQQRSSSSEAAALVQPARALLQGVSFSSSSSSSWSSTRSRDGRLETISARTSLSTRTRTATAAAAAAARPAKPAGKEHHTQSSSSRPDQHSTNQAAVTPHGSLKQKAGSSSSSSSNSERNDGVTLIAVTGRHGSASRQLSPETSSSQEGTLAAEYPADVEAFMQHSSSCLRVRQQPEVNIIITQAAGVTADQQPYVLADKLQQLESSPAFKELLALSGLTLAQAGRPQVIHLPAPGSTTDSFGKGGTLVAAAALGSDAAAIGHAWSGTFNGGSSNTSSSKGPAESMQQKGPAVAAPAVIGVAVAVAVSVVAVCVAAVVIVVVKQRAKQARAGGTDDQQQLPKTNKRRRSTKGKGATSKYLPTSHPALGHSTPDGMPPPPCVMVTALSSPCQHTPGHSPSAKLQVALPGHRSAPLVSVGSPLISLGSGPAASASGSGSGTTSAHQDLLCQAVTRGDSVSSAVMADFAEQRQRQQHEQCDAHDCDCDSAAGSETGEDGGVERAAQLHGGHQAGGVRGAAWLQAGSSNSSSPHRGPLQGVMLHHSYGHHSAGPSNGSSNSSRGFSQQGDQAQAVGCGSPVQRLRQQWEQGEGPSRSGSPNCSPAVSRLGEGPGSLQSGQAPTAAAAGHTSASAADCACEERTRGAEGLAAAVIQGFRLFSRRLSESSLPEELKQASACASVAAAEAAAEAVEATTAGKLFVSRGETASTTGSSLQPMRVVPSTLPTLRTLGSVNSSNQERCACPSSSTCTIAAKSSPFMAYDVSVLQGAASPASSLHIAGVKPIGAATCSSTAADSSSMLLRAWESSTGSTCGPAAFDPGCCLTEGVSTVHVRTNASTPFNSQKQLAKQQQQQQPTLQQLSSQPATSPAVRPSPFMMPCNLPPGVQ